MSRFFEDLEAQLDEAARAHAAGAPRSGDQPRSRWRRLRSGTRAVPVALAIVVTAAVVGVVGVTLHAGRHPRFAASNPRVANSPPHATGLSSSTEGGMQAIGSIGPLSPQQQREIKYVYAAQDKAMRTVACNPAPLPRPSISEGSPSAALLSVLGVLRRPATTADRLTVPHSSRPFYPVGGQNIYVRYIRRARVKDGVSYYIIPVGRLITSPAFSPRCYAKQAAELRSELPHIPAAERSGALALQAKQIAIFKRAPGQSPREGICVFDFNAAGTGGGSCDPTSQIVRTGSIQSDNSTLIGVVPAGVASVTLHYPAGNGLRALTITTNVVGNVFAVSIARLTDTGVGFPPDIAWRAPSGQVIKTISR